MVVHRAALGFTPRSSSAVLVAVGGDPRKLLDRRRIELVGGDLPGQAYHAAAQLRVEEASAAIEEWASAALGEVSRCLGEVLAGPVGDCHVVGVGIVSVVREVPSLEKVLRSHPLLHVAEGQLSREVLAEAAARGQLPVYYLPPKGPHNERHADEAAAMRREAGAPWRKEHKLAAMAAFAALTS